MAIEINVPDIGADEVEVTEILVSVGVVWKALNIEYAYVSMRGECCDVGTLGSPRACIASLAFGKLIVLCYVIVKQDRA